MPPNTNGSISNGNPDCTNASRGSEPKSALHLSSSNKNNDLLQLAAQELESMKRPKKQQSTKQPAAHISNEQSFPPACLRLMSSLPGNYTCIDCHSRTDISWASVSFGCLMCLQCSGKHRSLGVQTSFVKSVSMDGWKVHEILSMLEGGNEQLDQFFERHEMGKSGGGGDGNAANNLSSPTANALLDRYKTKAASFYRQHLINHAKELGEGGVYKGREASRSKSKKKSSSSSPSSSRKHQRSQQQPHQQPSKLLPTVTESSASIAESESATSILHSDNGDDAPLPPPLTPSQPSPMKRQRSKGSGTDVSRMDISPM